MILRPAMPRHALAEADRAAYLRHPEGADDFWDEAQAQAWGEGEAGGRYHAGASPFRRVVTGPGLLSSLGR